MPLRRLTCLTPLLLTLACGGGGSGPTPTAPVSTPMATDTAEAMTTAFLLAEHQQASALALPIMQSAGDLGVFKFQAPATLLECVQVTANGVGSLLLTFQGCKGPNGGVLTGKLAVNWNLDACTLSYQDLQATRGPQAWLLNGVRTIRLNRTLKQATAVSTGMVLAFTDAAAPSTNQVLTYASSLTSDWATAGSYKLWGSFSAQKGTAPTLTGTIPSSASLIWNAGCCYPLSGTLNLQQGLAKAELGFGAPCGGLTITPFGLPPLHKVLEPCP